MKAFRVKLRSKVDLVPTSYYVTYSDGLSVEQEKGRIMNTTAQVKACLRKWRAYECSVQLLDTTELGEMSSDTFKEDF